MTRWRIVTAFLALAVLPRLAVADEPAKDFFTAKVERVLVAHCLECHGSDHKGGLDLRTRKTALAGGESGPVIVPGKPDESLLVDYVSTEYMPPEHPLPKDEIKTLTRWVSQGAWFPDRKLDPFAFTTDKRAGLDWWSLQPIARPTPPAVDGPDGKPAAPIDAFVIRRLQKDGLGLSAPADRATYLRRVKYDLLGLPPTYDEIRAFVNDRNPDAYERLIDRLLASPKYGERWGRHWLDVVRYAESNGFERDRIRKNFWQYRDYVIDAFNRDLPYDRFVMEQLAGDAIRPDDPEALIATGFLVAGPKNDVTTISELERLNTRQDELDEYVVATGTTFLGLTVGCARCHNHKFDPISSKDYYELTAVFSGLDRGDNVVATPEEKARRQELAAAAKRKVDAVQKRIDTLLAPVRKRLVAKRRESGTTAEAPPVSPGKNVDAFDPVEARYLRFVVSKTNDGAQPCIDELEAYGPGSEKNLALAANGAKATASSLLPGFDIHQVNHLNDGEHGNAHSWISNEPGRGWAQIEFAAPVRIARVVWGRDRLGSYRDRLATEYRIEVSADGDAWTTVSGSARRAPFGSEPDLIPDEEVFAALSSDQQARFGELLKELSQAEAEQKRIPPLPVCYSARDGAPKPAYLLRRGDVRNWAEEVQPAGLRAVTALPSDLTGKRDAGPERRRRLAEWIVHPKNPLTARVMVNRVWHYHFGRGIVGTPSDFGFNGDKPTHPELLDWLAADFIEHGWRIKRLHRQIALSAAYRQSSRFRPEAAAKDGDARRLWRFNPRRLEAESLRDAILQTSGNLDLSMGGPSFRLFQYRDGNVPDYVRLKDPGPETWRRAVYKFNIRTFHDPLMSAFDCPNPSVQTPDRQSTTTALQALSLMNNVFSFEQARHFAERVGRAADTPIEQVTAAYRLALARDPTVEERRLGAQFIRDHGLFGLCRVLINLNEFLYVY